MHDLFTRMNDLAIKKTGGFFWQELFNIYDKNKDNLLDKIELKELAKDCGFNEITDAEIGFAFNVMSFFQKHITRAIFLEWVNVTFILYLILL